MPVGVPGCGICRLPNIEEINAALFSGNYTDAQVTVLLGLDCSPDRLGKHRLKCLGLRRNGLKGKRLAIPCPGYEPTNGQRYCVACRYQSALGRCALGQGNCGTEGQPCELKSECPCHGSPLDKPLSWHRDLERWRRIAQYCPLPPPTRLSPVSRP